MKYARGLERTGRLSRKEVNLISDLFKSLI